MEVKNKIEIIQPPKTVVILGGGGIKGYAHIGALEALEKANIPIDSIIGCSVGSIIGAFYADGKNPKEIYEIAKRYTFKRYSYQFFGTPNILNGLRGDGFFYTHKLERILHDNLTNKRIEDLNTPLQIAATDLYHAKLKLFETGNLIKSTAASAAVPGIFSAVEIDGIPYVDGSVMEVLPIKSIDRNNRFTIGIDIKSDMPIGRQDISNQVMRSYQIAEDNRSRNPDIDIYIKPKLGSTMFSATSKEAEEMYQEGKRATEAMIPLILKKMESIK